MKKINTKKPCTAEEWIKFFEEKEKKQLTVDKKFREWGLKQLEKM